MQASSQSCLFPGCLPLREGREARRRVPGEHSSTRTAVALQNTTKSTTKNRHAASPATCRYISLKYGKEEDMCTLDTF